MNENTYSALTLIHKAATTRIVVKYFVISMFFTVNDDYNEQENITSYIIVYLQIMIAQRTNNSSIPQW